ncbi:hypothetical protein AMATHDRAFT_9794 [Amanita thiersii Skay4041]|uniref:Uncharacterized protein n=1 Tax=Amanita thiersii Skay4041 TaxID=703135 RepID=A0A2A9NAC0_9AGAR|nr:hypothetical protein AMATHDRAFT_9794 [Amanita thiersii Skay4041]
MHTHVPISGFGLPSYVHHNGVYIYLCSYDNPIHLAPAPCLPPFSTPLAFSGSAGSSKKPVTVQISRTHTYVTRTLRILTILRENPIAFQDHNNTSDYDLRFDNTIFPFHPSILPYFLLPIQYLFHTTCYSNT